MADLEKSLNQIRGLIRAAAYAPAESQLAELLRTNRQSPEANALAGLVRCLTQREDEALEFLTWCGSKGGPYPCDDAQTLGQILTDYTHCRALMAEKLAIKDELGTRMRAQLADLIDLQPSADVGITLSACMIVKNEEKVLERCLKSLAGFVDEIALIDTGSTDGTVEIAERHGAKIGHFAWCDDFSAARNESLKLASGHWALWIDADEELAREGWNAIREALIRPHYGGYFITIVNYMAEGNQADQYVHTPVRLFRRMPAIRFVSRIHEQVMPSVIAAGLPFATLASAKILHYGYQASSMDEKGKLDRAISMLEREVREFPEDSFHWFNLTNAYAVGSRHREVARAGKICLQKMDAGDRYRSLTYHLVMSSVIALGRPAEALAYYEEAVSTGCADILVEFQRAQALLTVGSLDAALDSVDRCLSMPWPEGTTGDYGIVTHKTHTLKGKILLKLGRYEEALEIFDYALSIDPKFGIALQGRGLALESMGRLGEALETFGAGIDVRGVESVAKKNMGRVLIKLGRHLEAARTFEQIWRAEPTDHDAWVGWVQACEGAGDVARVVEAYSAYAEAHAPSVDMLIGWGRALDAAGESERALSCFTEAIKRDPRSANAFFNSGDLLYRQGQYADAAHLYEQGLRISPGNAQGWFVLGNSLAQLGLAEGAVTAFGKALEIQPGHAEARNNLEFVLEALQSAA